MAEKKKKVTIDENPSGIKGLITLNESVVSTIAGLAAREVDGIYSVGKSSFLHFGDDPKHGLSTEVGKIQAAFDIDVVMEYGKDVREVAKNLRGKIAAEVSKMAGREVVEININVVDIKLPGREEEPPKGRVL